MFHGAKRVIDGEIAVRYGRRNNVFGHGFYTGESYEQAILFVSGFNNSSIYYLSFDDKDLQCKRYEINQEWVMTIAYYRGALDKYALLNIREMKYIGLGIFIDILHLHMKCLLHKYIK